MSNPKFKSILCVCVYRVKFIVTQFKLTAFYTGILPYVHSVNICVFFYTLLMMACLG
jgi:hypothetical protein